MTRIPIGYLAIFLPALHAVAAAAIAPTTITLRPTAQATGEVVVLQDVAEVTPPQAAQALANMELGPTPAPGVPRTLTAGYVKVRLRRAGVNLEGTLFQGERTVVTRAAAAHTSLPVATPPAPTAATPGTGPDLKPGAKVVLLLRVGSLQITTEAEALRACNIGQEGLFRVRETQAMVKARLLDPQRAEVIR